MFMASLNEFHMLKIILFPLGNVLMLINVFLRDVCEKKSMEKFFMPSLHLLIELQIHDLKENHVKRNTWVNVS